VNHQEILEKAIAKAIDGGWEPTTVSWSVYGESIYFTDRATNYREIIFNHNFAKALWGNYSETMTVQNNTLNVKQVVDMDGWRYHLQQMVIADDPIEYLGANI